MTKLRMGIAKVNVIAGVALLALMYGCNKDTVNNNPTSNNDKDYMTMAAYSNMDEIAAGQLAAAKSSDTAVMMFGQMMISDHSTAETDLQTLASQKGATLPSGPDSAHVAMKAMMMTLSGRAFDSTYILAQIKDHQNTIQLFQNEMNNGSDQDVKNYANKYMPKIQMHLHLADSIATAMHFL